MSLPAEPSTIAERARSRALPAPLPHPLPRRLEVVVDLRAPEQLVIDLEHPAGPFLAQGEGLLGARRWQLVAKRALDLVAAGLLVVLSSPVFLGAALLVKLSSRGPVFFAQERIGRGGRAFRFLKFRTMCRDAAAHRGELNDQNEADGPVFKIRHDPRITRVGRVLRKLSIDELPQLLHVLSGEMSLVGPRPPLPGEVAAYSQWESQRLLVKPGLTCIWQVSGRSDLDFHTWVTMDIEYIRDWSLWLDLKLLVRTVPAVLSGHGAY